MTPVSGSDLSGHVVRSWLRSAWAQSRAHACSWGSEGEWGSGLLSWMRRLPRSKVYGIGLVTVIGLACGELRVRIGDNWGGVKGGRTGVLVFWWNFRSEGLMILLWTFSFRIVVWMLGLWSFSRYDYHFSHDVENNHQERHFWVRTFAAVFYMN